MGGLDGLALRPGKEFPTKGEVFSKIPKELLKKDTTKSMLYAAFSTVTTLMAGYLGFLIPQTWAMGPVWLAYAALTGTLATGCWVIAHECGHDAFSENKFLQDAVGYILHTALLVPYFSWQRSHAVHHANCNSIENGETHVPKVVSDDYYKFGMREKLGKGLFGIYMYLTHYLVGWPAYILFGKSGGPKYG